MMLFPRSWAPFLRTTVIDNPFIYLDYWSLVHLCSGIIIGIILYLSYKRRFGYLLAFLALIVYELFEYRFWDVMFVPEPAINIVWDLIVGMLGYFLAVFLLGKIKKSRAVQALACPGRL